MVMVDDEGPHQKAWPMEDNTPEGMADNEASLQKTWPIVGIHTSRHD